MENRDSNWLGTVERASSASDLLEIVHAFMQVNALDLGLLPGNLRPQGITNIDALVDAAYTLSAALRDSVGTDEANEALDHVATFFGVAANRATYLSSVPLARRVMRDLDLEEG